MTTTLVRTLRAAGVLTLAVAAMACTDDTEQPDTVVALGAPEVLVGFDRAQPGDIVGVIADDERRVVSWVHRRDGTVHELSLDEPGSEPRRVATLAVSTESQQGGLLDQALLPNGDRALVWTEPEDNELVLGLLGDDEASIEWSAGRAGNGAIGGTLTPVDGALLLAVGRNTAWDAESLIDGAVLRFELDGGGLNVEGEPEIVSSGYTNPWAVGVVTGPDGEEIWVWDNAAGPDPDDADVEDTERIGRADLVADRQQMTRSTVPDRAPAALVGLPGALVGVCGFLDNELLAYQAIDGPAGARSELERADSDLGDPVMSCTTGAAVFDDGTIVTAGQSADGEALLVRRPAP